MYDFFLSDRLSPPQNVMKSIIQRGGISPSELIKCKLNKRKERALENQKSDLLYEFTPH